MCTVGKSPSRVSRSTALLSTVETMAQCSPSFLEIHILKIRRPSWKFHLDCGLSKSFFVLSRGEMFKETKKC